MNIPKSLLQTYQAEYEHTNITIDELCKKYDVTTKQLKGYTKWKKKELPVKQEKLVLEPKQSKNPDISGTLAKDIDRFKELAMKHALKFMENDVEFAEVREFKDMVSIVGTIEASIKDTKPENTINIAIQNIIREFKDDC